MLNVSKPTVDALQQMVDESFLMTAYIDNMQSNLDAKFAYNNTALLIHHGMAHQYSGYFGDKIADLGLQGYNIVVKYGNIPRIDKEYDSVSDLLYQLKEYVFNYQIKLNGCYKIAMANNDIHVAADLIRLIKEHNKLVRQSILLCDKIDLYKDSPSFDAHVLEYFNLLGVEK